mgnify:CR=1 FL=1
MNKYIAEHTKRPLTEEERVFSEKHHDLMYRYMRLHELDPEEWYDILIIPYLNAVKKYHQYEKLHNLKFEQVFFRTLDNARSNYFRDINRKKRCPKGGVVSLDYMVEDDKSFSKYKIDAWWIDKTKNVEAYVIEKEFLRDLFANVGKYAEPELLELVLKMRIKGYTDTEIAKRARFKLDNYREWTLAEMKELIGLLTRGRNRYCAMTKLVKDTQKYGNIEVHDKWERMREMFDI